jgi:hypothetical protein
MRFTEKQRLRKDVARLKQQVAWLEETLDNQGEVLETTLDERTALTDWQRRARALMTDQQLVCLDGIVQSKL